MLCWVMVLNGMAVEEFWGWILTHRILRTCDLRPSLSQNLYAPYLKDQGDAVSITANGTLSNTGGPANMPRHLLIDNDAQSYANG